MFASVAFVLLILLLNTRETEQQFAGCAESYYLLDGSCESCPERCAACISDFNCTKCKGSHYGPVCQHTCQEDCEHFCHKEYGYCTYGCVDGQFPVKNSSQCALCPTKCKLCNSKTTCAECLSGNYGSACEDRCPTHCETCNKTTGACLKCYEGYFNKNDKCRRCPDGCVSCHDNTNCTICRAGYLWLNEYQCIKECAIGSNGIGLDQDEHYKEDEALRCCMKTTNGQRVVHTTLKPCIQYATCSSDILCPSKNDDNNACGTIKTYQCNHTCHKLTESDCQCKPNCIIIEQNEPASLLCLTRQERIFVIQLSMDSECSNVSENPPSSTYQRISHRMNIPVVVSVVLGLMYIAMGLYIIWMKKWCHNIWKSRIDTVNVEEAMNMEHGNNEGTRTEPLLNQSSQESPKIPHSLNRRETFDTDNDTQKTERPLLNQTSEEYPQLDKVSHNSNPSDPSDADSGLSKTEGNAITSGPIKENSNAHSGSRNKNEACELSMGHNPFDYRSHRSPFNWVYNLSN